MLLTERVRSTWHRAAAESVVWQRLEPVRRLWTAAEQLVWREGERGYRDGDERAIQVVQSSRLGRSADAAVRTALAAWRESRVRDRFIRSSALAAGATRRVRFAGAVTVIASATAITAGQLTPRHEPFVWIIPAIALGIGLLLMIIGPRSSR